MVDGAMVDGAMVGEAMVDGAMVGGAMVGEAMVGKKRNGGRNPSAPYRPLPPYTALFRRLLIGWYRKNARELPWRATRDPYRVLVSEFMLQQTQVSRVEEYYPKFLARYPTLEHLARAKPKAVRESWEGLGYYARARNLHALAKTVVQHHDSAIPSDPETLQTLPGVGRYTAGAVASFAFEKREAAVDTNVKRVLERAFKGERGKGKSKTTLKDIWALAQTILPAKGRVAWEFNQALMDLGATICVARKPKCPECPVRRACKTGRNERTRAVRRLGTRASNRPTD